MPVAAGESSYLVGTVRLDSEMRYTLNSCSPSLDTGRDPRITLSAPSSFDPKEEIYRECVSFLFQSTLQSNGVNHEAQ